MRGRFLTMALGVASCGASVLFACGGGDPEGDTPAKDSGLDAFDSSTPDTSSAADARDGSTPIDSGADAADAADAAPTISAATGPTGAIQIFADAVFASFSEDDTIVRVSNAPECVIRVRSITKPTSPAGKLTVGGPIVGSDGGAQAVITITPSSTNKYTFFGPVFGSDDSLLVQLESTGSTAFPSIPVQSLRPPPADSVVVTKPVPPAEGVKLVVPSTQALELKWSVPASTNAKHRIAFGFWNLVGSAAKRAALYCSYPLSQGQATVPTDVLAELKRRVGTNANGLFHLYAGDQKELATAGASYVIELTRDDSTDLPDVEATLQ